MPTAGGVSKALMRGRELGCEVVQLFVKNNMQWFGKPVPEAELTEFARLRAAAGFACVFAHSGYLINLGAPPSPNRDNSLKSLLQELQLCQSLKLPFLVLHPGAHLGQGEEQGLAAVIAGLDEVLGEFGDPGVRIALESTAGQGTCLGAKLTHLFEIVHRARHGNRLALCLDTAHLFAAGHDLRQAKVWDETISEIDREMGTERIVAFHLNDSKAALGSRVDRHAGIGEGQIGLEAFRHILNDSRFQQAPGCLETPKSPDLHEDVENLARLRGLLDAAEAGRRPTVKTKRKPRVQSR